MDLTNILKWNAAVYILILARWAGMIMLAPVFGAREVPVTIRLAISASIAIVVYPLIIHTNPRIPDEMLAYGGIVIKETLIGLVIGFIIYTFSAVIQGTGQLLDYQLGFTMGNAIDPVYGMQSPLMGNFQLILATMILLSTNAHHFLIAAMIKSYDYLPVNPSAFAIRPNVILSLLSNVFAISIQLALPVLGAVFLADIGLGLLARSVPQLNIFAVVFPLKIIFGIILLILALPLFGENVRNLFQEILRLLLLFYQGSKQ